MTKLAGLTLVPQTEAAASTVASVARWQRYSTRTQTLEGRLSACPRLAGLLVTFPWTASTRRSGAGRLAQEHFQAKPTARRGGVPSGGWTANDTYTLKVVRYRTPFITTAPGSSRTTTST